MRTGRVKTGDRTKKSGSRERLQAREKQTGRAREANERGPPPEAAHKQAGNQNWTTEPAGLRATEDYTMLHD